MSCGSRKTPAIPSTPRTQPFPASGLLTRNLDSALASLQRMGPNLLAQPVYAYIVTTVKKCSGMLGQTGSAPNFQGNCITLCTCKHKDRASWPPEGRRGNNLADHWQGMWVAGLCSPREFRPRALFYLMLVEASYDSHASLWNALRMPVRKSARRDVFGDVYEPLAKPTSAPWAANSYAAHLPGHVHDTNDRRKDIEASYHGRYPRLLLGEPAHSYLWSAPSVRLKKVEDAGWKSAHHRFYPDLASFLATLQ